MRIADEVRELDELETELNGWVSLPELGFKFWQDRMNSLISAIAGANSPQAIRFNFLSWKSNFIEAALTSRELISTLRWMVKHSSKSEVTSVDQAIIDPDLWNHVRSSVEANEWDRVALNACVFCEDRLRRWAHVPVGSKGTLQAFDYALAHGRFELGDTTSERDGWRLLGKGIALALRNRSGHRIHEGLDPRRYAFGVLGIVSLLLTEIRNAYGDPPQVPTPST